MAQPLELRGEASLSTIAEFVARVAEVCSRSTKDEEACYALKLAVEEVCLNVFQHGYGRQPGPLELTLRDEEGRFVVTITDAAAPFNPAQAPPADLESDWETRTIGGLGWHLVRTMMDSVEHELTPGGGNRVTLTKHHAA